MLNGSIADPKAVRRTILRNLRSALLELGSATKAELSDRLGVSFPTVSKFLGQMEKAGELLPVQLDDSSGGRRANRYSYNPEVMLGLALFLERTETSYIVFNCAGEVKDQGHAASVLTADITDFDALIAALVNKHPQISAVSVGVPAAVNNGRLIYIPEYEQFHDLDLKAHCEQRFQLPTVIENDMNAAVYGYYMARHQRSKLQPSLVYLYFGQNGPGSGIMLDGNIMRGSSFFSGEVSFVPLYDQYNFGEAMRASHPHPRSPDGDLSVDAVARLIAVFAAVLNPHGVILSRHEANEGLLAQLEAASQAYIPREHLPAFILGDWEQDYLYGLQGLSLDLMLSREAGGN